MNNGISIPGRVDITVDPKIFARAMRALNNDVPEKVLLCGAFKMAIVRGQIKQMEILLFSLEEILQEDEIRYADTVTVDEPEDLTCFGVGETPLERAVNPDNIMRPPPIIEGMQCEGAAPACESCPPRMRVTPIKRQCRIIRFPLEV